MSSRFHFTGPLKGLFLLVTIAFRKGHLVARYVRSLAPLTPFIHSAALRFAMIAPLALGFAAHGLAHSLRSLPCGMIKIHESVFTLKSHLKETNMFDVVIETRPWSYRWMRIWDWLFWGTLHIIKQTRSLMSKLAQLRANLVHFYANYIRLELTRSEKRLNPPWGTPAHLEECSLTFEHARSFVHNFR